MAFCEKCGAYIPIDETVCPACGYDPGAEKRREEEEARRAEEERKAEAARRAEEEARTRARQAENARRAAEEKERRAREEREREEQQYWQQQKQKWQEEANKYKYKYSGGSASATQGEYSTHKSGSTQQESWVAPWETASQNHNTDPRYEEFRQQAARSVGNQKLSILSYLGILFLVPYLTQKGDDFARYHANQGLLLFITSALTQTVGRAFGLVGLAGGVFTLFCMVKGISNVLHGKKEPLPLIGGFNLLK